MHVVGLLNAIYPIFAGYYGRMRKSGRAISFRSVAEHYLLPFTDIVKRLTPRRWHLKLALWKERADRLRYYGRTHCCPVCRSSLRGFSTFDFAQRANAECPVCHALERHRLMWLYWQERTDLFDARPKSMLHLAPEACFARRLRHRPGLRYVTADLTSPHADLRADFTRLPIQDKAFDVVFASHVLEHVPDDRRAMRECYRVLKPGGWAILQVPIAREKTFEDPSAQTPAERLRLFGQDDHVRIYGQDYADRLRDAGFEVCVDDWAKTLKADQVARCGLAIGEAIFRCRKRGLLN